MAAKPLAISRGDPLDTEPGVGALTMGGWLREVCAAGGDDEALVFDGDGERVSWSYAELWERAVEVARALHSLGIGKGERVGVLMTNRPEFITGVWGAALAGGVATGLNTFSTAAELEHMLAASGVSVLLLERQVLNKDFAGMLGEIEPAVIDCEVGALRSIKLPFLRHVAAIGGASGAIEDWPDFLARADQVDPAVIDATAETVTPADPGLLFFSSGSTALPKGIVNAHRAVCLQLWRWRRFYRTESDARTWSANGFFFSGNFGMAIGGTLSAGGTLVLQSTFQVDEALELMERERASMAIAWPHQWAQLAGSDKFAGADLSAMKYVRKGTPFGDHPSIDTPWQEPMAAYGNTETFTVSSIFPSGTPEETIAGSSGKPQPGIVVKVVDPLTDEILPVGERGEIAVKGATLMLGYLGVPIDETLDEEGYFRSGDGGYIDAEGRLFWEGRLNDIIKTGGANVSPLEVDERIRALDGVKITQTVGVPHDTLGEMVVTAIVPHDGASLSEDDVRGFAKETLASYKVPRRVLFFTEDELKTTGSAKIKTSEVRDLAGKRLAGESAGRGESA